MSKFWTLQLEEFDSRKERIQMATKENGIPCYDKAAFDEPLFVLRAQDALSPTAVRAWADLAETLGVSMEKVDEAREVANAMEHWPKRRLPT